MPNAKNLPFSFAMNINTQSEDGGVDLPAQQDACFSIAMMGTLVTAPINLISAIAVL